MTTATDRIPDLLHSLQQAPLRFISDERSGCVVVERTDDRHALSSEVVQRIADLSRHTAKDLVLLLDDDARLSGSGQVAQLMRAGTRRFGAIHALCFPAGIGPGAERLVRQQRLTDGLWLVSFAKGTPTPDLLTESHELQVVRRWLQKIQEQRRESTATEVQSATTGADHDDDDQSSDSGVVERRIAMRNRLLKEVPMIAAEQWGELSGNSGKNPSAALGKYKSTGRLFAVTHGNRNLYPAFQFSENDARPKPQIAAVLERVPEPARGWPLLSWFAAPNVFLSNKRPLEVLDSDPQAVAEAADRFYGRDD